MASSSSPQSKRLIITKPFSLAAFLVIVSCCAHLALAARELSTAAGDDKAMRERYEKWMAEYGRTYQDSAEKARRFEVFKANAHFIDSYNAAAGPGGSSRARLTTNKFADLTEAELSSGAGHRIRPPTTVTGTGFIYGNLALSDVPASIDWREKGAVTPVKDQGGICDCCWAFSAVAAVEAIHQMRTNNLVSLSAQELLDCSTGANNRGCNLGDADEAFRHIFHSGGITSEDAYEYEAKQSTCRSSGKQVAATINGFQHVPKRNETALLLAVAHQPVSVALDGNALHHYATGVFGAGGGDLCSTTDRNHAMTIVGYGTDEYGTKYWLAKNSWGSTWGEQGYARIARDVASSTGLCGLAMEAVYPIG